MAASGSDEGLSDATIRIQNGENAGTEITAMFNPTEYSRSKGIQYGEQDIAGLSSPVAQFVSGEAETLSMELFFDTSEERADVTDETDQLDLLLTVDKTLGAPPFCTFVWGGIEFKAVLENADKQFTMFRGDGTPIRARVNVTFKEYRPPSTQQKQEKSKPSDNTQRRTVKEGDTLWGIAKEEYGDPTQWKRIAGANGIDNPRTLQPGTELTIPPRSS